jgi:hypothetical protein
VARARLNKSVYDTGWVCVFDDQFVHKSRDEFEQRQIRVRMIAPSLFTVITTSARARVRAVSQRQLISRCVHGREINAICVSDN